MVGYLFKVYWVSIAFSLKCFSEYWVKGVTHCESHYKSGLAKGSEILYLFYNIGSLASHFKVVIVAKLP